MSEGPPPSGTFARLSRRSLAVRVYGSLAALLALTVFGAWTVAAGGVLRPLLRGVMKDRIDLAFYVAEEVGAAPEPGARAAELAEALGIELRLTGTPPRRLLGRSPRRTLSKGARSLEVYGGRRTPVVLALDELPGRPYLVMWFPVDLSAPTLRAAIGLGVLGLGALIAAFVAGRWVLRPLDTTLEGMGRVAAGDLSHRLPDEPGITGRMAGSFNQMAEQVQRLVRGQRQLMAAISHELRTPLARMRVTAELLSDAGVPAQRVESLNADIDEIDALVGELLESARLEQGALALQRGTVELRALAEEALGAVALGERSVRLDVPEALRLSADRARLLRALCNLLSNAARYTPEEAEITIRAERQPGAVLIAVADNGPGVPEDALERLFDPFFRAEGSRSRVTGGLGLGLMLVRQIAEAHDGHAVAVSRPGGGLEVQLLLPDPSGAPDSAAGFEA